MDCVKCGSAMTPLAPAKDAHLKAFGCTTCGYVCDDGGKPIVTNNKQLGDVFRAATEGSKTLRDVFGIDKMDPATKAAMTSKLLEYGTQMWFDGLKQGLLMSAIQEQHGKAGSN